MGEDRRLSGADPRVVREAIDKMIEERRGDAEFQARLKAMMKEGQKVLERLAR